MQTNHAFFMSEAIAQAKLGLQQSGIPIGSVLVKDNQVIAKGHNQRIQKGSAILHAEMDCIENAGRLSAKDYAKCTIYSTLSPCEMWVYYQLLFFGRCTGAILLYKIPIVVIGENETFKGPEDYSKSKGVELINLDSDECKNLMIEFISQNPTLWNEDIGE